MGSRRRHSTVVQLPPEVVAAVNSLLVEPGVTYDDIVEFIKTKGHDVSRSAVGRYGKDFMTQLQEVRVLEEQAQAVIAEGGTPLAMEEALSKLFTAKVMSNLLNGKTEAGLDLNFAIDSFSKLQRSSVARELMKKELKEKVDKAAKKIDNIAKKGGITPDTLDKIKRELYGIVAPN